MVMMTELALIILAFAGRYAECTKTESLIYQPAKVPEANVLEWVEKTNVESDIACSTLCHKHKNENVQHKCKMFKYDQSTKICKITGNLARPDMRWRKPKMMEVWKEKTGFCQRPAPPSNGEWACEMDAGEENCYVVCKPGYVFKKRKIVFCWTGQVGKRWGYDLDELQCVPSVLVMMGNSKSPYNLAQLVTAGSTRKLPDFYYASYATKLKGGVLQYHRGYMLYCLMSKMECLPYDGTKSVSTIDSYDFTGPTHTDLPTAVAFRMLYIIGSGGVTVFDDMSHPANIKKLYSGPKLIVPNLATSDGCAARFSNMTLLYIGGKIAAEYDMIYGGPLQPHPAHLNHYRIKAGCDIFLDKSGKESIIIAGGDPTQDAEAESTTEIFDRATETWKKVGNLNFPRFYHKIVTTTDGTYAVGGENSAGEYITQVEKFNVASETWEDTGLKTLEQSQFGAAAVPSSLVP